MLIFGSFLGHFGNFGSFLGQFGQFWVIFWAILGNLRSFLGHFLVLIFLAKSLFATLGMVAPVVHRDRLIWCDEQTFEVQIVNSLHMQWVTYAPGGIVTCDIRSRAQTILSALVSMSL